MVDFIPAFSAVHVTMQQLKVIKTGQHGQVIDKINGCCFYGTQCTLLQDACNILYTPPLKFWHVYLCKM